MGGAGNWLARRDVLAAWRADTQPIAGETLIEKGFRYGLAGVRAASPYHLLLGHDLPGRQAARKPGRSDRYVLGWFAALAGAAALLNANHAGWAAAAVVAVCALRLVELYAYYLWEVMAKKPDGRSGRGRFELIERRILFLLLDVAQVAAGFGLASQALGRLAPSAFAFSGPGGVGPRATFDYIYMAAGQMLTVGSKFSPMGEGAEALHLAMVAGGVLLLVVVFSSVVGYARYSEQAP